MKRFSIFSALALLGASASMPTTAADGTAELELGKKLFTQSAVPACALCHTLKDANATGAVGPVLDEIKPDANRVATALRNGLGQMPSYKTSLSEAQIVALSRYVATVTSAAK